MSKMRLFKEAENLYIEEGLSIEDICKNLGISRRTIFYWKKKYEWDKIRNKKYKTETKFSTELMEAALNFMRKISTDIDNKTPVTQAEYYTLINLIKNIPTVVKYEKSVANDLIKQYPKPQCLTPEIIRQIQKNILGWDGNI